MTLKVAGVVIAAAALAVPTAASAKNLDKATGGGQVVTDTKTTIAFTAQQLADNEDAAKGQVQYNNHAGSKRHGSVICVRAMGDGSRNNGAAVFVTRWRKGDDGFTRFYVVDGGEGGDAVDTLYAEEFAANDEPSCEVYDDEGTPEQLDRGNFQVRDGDPENSFAPDDDGLTGSLASAMKLANIRF